MNCGLSNLDTLRKAVAAFTGQALTVDDSFLQTLGHAALGMFERHCNRRFVFTAGAVETCSADRCHWTVQRYPILSVTSVEFIPWGGDASAMDTEPQSERTESGIVFFSGTLGGWQDEIRLTYSGGYHVEFAEPEDNAYPTTVVEGATVLPGDLQAAFFMQVGAMYRALSATSKEQAAAPADAPEMPAHVTAVLDGYIRRNLS